MSFLYQQIIKKEKGPAPLPPSTTPPSSSSSTSSNVTSLTPPNTPRDENASKKGAHAAPSKPTSPLPFPPKQNSIESQTTPSGVANVQVAVSTELAEPVPGEDDIVVELKPAPASQVIQRSDSAKIIAVRTNSGEGISVTSNTIATNSASSNQSMGAGKENTATITINSDLPDPSNSLASNISQVTVVTSHPPVIVDNSMPPSIANEVVIVSNETNKSQQIADSSTDDDYPSLDSLECNAGSRAFKHHGQSTIIIGDSPTPSSHTPSKQPHNQVRARKLDESEVFIVNNEVDLSVLSDNGDKSLDKSHVSVVTVGEEIRVKDSSNTKTPQSHANRNNATTVDGIDNASDDNKYTLSTPNAVSITRNKAINQNANENANNATPAGDDDVNIIVNKKKTKPKISPDSSVGSIDSRTQSECGSIRSSVGTPSPAINKSMDRSDVESIATTNSHDSCNAHDAPSSVNVEEEPVIIRRTKPDRSERTKEEIELRNLKKKTRKRTRKFEIDGVQVTTTTSKVIYGDDENGKMYDDHIFRKQELRELKMLQKQEKKQFLDLQIKEQASKEQQERRFDQERIALERTYEADMDTLARQHRQLIEKTEQQQEADLRSTSKKIRAEQERDLKLVRFHLHIFFRYLANSTFTVSLNSILFIFSQQ